MKNRIWKYIWVMKTQQLNKHGNGLVKATQLARTLGVGSKTIRNWAEVGIIPVAYVAGCTMRFNPQDVLDALNASTGKLLAKKSERQNAARPTAGDEEKSKTNETNNQ